MIASFWCNVSACSFYLHQHRMLLTLFCLFPSPIHLLLYRSNCNQGHDGFLKQNIIMFCIIILLNNCKGQIRLGWTHIRICKNIKNGNEGQYRILTNSREGAPLHRSLVCTNNDSSLPPDRRRDFWWRHSSVIGISHVNHITIRFHSEQPYHHKIKIYGSSFEIINSEDLRYPACKHH